MGSNLSRKMKHWISILCLLAFAVICGSEEPISVSQISPKSQSLENPLGKNFQTHSSLSSSADQIALNFENDYSNDHDELIEKSKIHTRIERSAMPIINELSSRPSLDVGHLHDFESNDVDVSGRYFNYIKPTATLADADGPGLITKSERMGKDLSEKSENSFLSKGGPRPITSGSPINPTSTASQMMSPAATAINPNHPRQKPNPDIQDIITGIVKLLNGNVNVHANTQILRRPIASRINNRGPPRISEAQAIPVDYDGPKVIESTLLPPPFPFDRPDGPIRPFITGVPLPEQIVPQNYRPGFVSQNRPPWHRPRPRPPIGGRRPLPPYKPIPPLIDYHPEDEIQFTTLEAESNETVDVDSPSDADSNNNDKFYFSSSTNFEEDTPTTMEIPVKKEDHMKKKDTKIKSSEKKPIIPITQTQKFEPTMTTIIRSTSVVNTAQVIASTSLGSSEIIGLEPSSTLESSIEEFTPTTSTSSLFSITETPTLIEVELSTSPTTISPKMEATPIITSTVIDSSATSKKAATTTITSPIPASTSTTEEPPRREIVTQPPSSSTSTLPYHPRPGIVLDDPEFKPGGGAHRPNQRPQRPAVQPTRHTPPPGYGEIFDVTLSAIQGPGSGSGSKQTINIKPFGSQYGGTGNDDIIISPSGEEGFVSIDGKRTYINLFGESTDAPTPSTVASSTVPASELPLSPGVTGTGYAVPEADPLPQPTKSPKPLITPTQLPSQRPHYRPRTTQPPVRIDTCIVGDDSTCDQAQNERCKTDNGVSSCHCRPGYSRRKHREPCRRVVSFFMGLRVDRIYERRIVWDKLLLDRSSEPYGHLSYESVRAIDSAMSMTPFSDEFMEARVNNIYHGDPSQGTAGVFVNLTLKLEENAETLRPNLRSDVQKHLLGVIHRRNNNIGNSVLYVESPPGSISNLQDLDECESEELNDCHSNAQCTNVWGSFRCQCETGYRDPWADQPQRSGRDCQSCPDAYCNNRGVCNYDGDAGQVCTCDGSYYGSQCEIDGEVLGVAIGASVAAVIIIVLTLICLIMWSRRWQREQKNAMGSPVFGYMATSPVKTSTMGQAPYQVTLEDRMRWAQIADVMAQANHYAAEPVASTRPSSAMFGYPNLQAMNMGALGGMSMAGTLPMHQGPMPPIPLPRLGLNSRSNGMRTLDNSSSSEEEDRTDLLGRNFQVPRPKSRSNGSIANQSGIYYDVEYEPSGAEMYGTTTTSISNQIPGPQGIPMSTYTSGRAPSMYYMK